MPKSKISSFQNRARLFDNSYTWPADGEPFWKISQIGKRTTEEFEVYFENKAKQLIKYDVLSKFLCPVFLHYVLQNDVSSRILWAWKFIREDDDKLVVQLFDTDQKRMFEYDKNSNQEAIKMEIKKEDWPKFHINAKYFDENNRINYPIQPDNSFIRKECKFPLSEINDDTIEHIVKSKKNPKYFLRQVLFIVILEHQRVC